MNIERTPYPGLRSFKREETDLFFGRDDCVAAMIERLRVSRFLAVLGSSGTGKSSLVNTGLLAGLEMGLLPGQGSRWWVVDFKPGDSPLRNLARRLLETESGAKKSNLGQDEIAMNLLRARLKRGPRSLIEWCREGHLAEGTNLLLLVDQFEELFRYKDYAGGEEAEAFVALLLESRHPTGVKSPNSAELPIHVALTMRSEYLGACSLFEGLAEAVNGGTFLTPRMTRDQCREAIEGPAKVCGIEIEPALVNTLVNDLVSFAPWEDIGVEDQLNRLARRADQLPLLQYTLNRMWARARERNDRPVRIRLQDYDAKEGLGGELNAHANEICARLGERLRPTVETVFRTLTKGTTPADAVRRPTRVDELVALCDGNEKSVRSVLDAFRAAGVNFLLPENDPAASRPLDMRDYVDISHESLIRQWHDLSRWVQQEGRAAHEWQRLKERSEQWNAGHGELMRGLELRNAIAWYNRQKPNEAWAARYGNAFKETRAFLATSRRRARIVRSTVLIGSIAIILAAWLAYHADQARLAAEQARSAAERGQSLAQLQHSRLLADRASQSIEDDDAGTAAVLALEALPDARSGVDRPKAPEAETALVHALQRLQELVVLKGHTDWINQAAFDSQGERVVTASKDKTARIWKVATGEQLATLPHNDEVGTALFSPDARYVVTASRKTARIWDLSTNKVVQTLAEHEGLVETVAFSPDGKFLVTASEDKTARIWNVETGELVRTLKGHAAQVWSAVFSPDGRRIVTASRDRTARIWDAVTGDELKSLRGHTDSVWLAAFNLAGNRVLTASRDSTVRIWDAENAKELKTIRPFDDIVAAGFSDDGSRIVLTGRDNKLRIFDAESGYEITARNGHRDWILSTSFSRDGTRIVTGSRDYTARIWDAETSQTISGLEAKGGPVSGAAFSPGARLVATSSRESTSARVWDVKSGKAVAVLNGHEKPVWSTAFIKEGTRVVTASEDKTARIWSSEMGVPLTVLSGHQGTVWSAAFSSDGKYVVTASADTTARIWDAETGASVVILGTGAGTAGNAIEGGHNNDVLSAGFSADAKRVVTGSRDSTLLVWDLEGRKRFAELSDVYGDDVVSAVFSPVNRSLVASASTDGSAHIWNVDTNTITALKGHNGPVWSVAFNSNGRQVVTASGDMTARVWDAESGQLVQTFKGHSNWVFSAAFTADDKHVVTASRDKTVRIWDIETGDDVTGGVISGSTQELVERAKERVPRCLTRDQREKAFLAAEPPAWCIEMEKWPYHTQDWKDWLRFKIANADPPLPDTPEWQPWIAAHRLDRG